LLRQKRRRHLEEIQKRTQTLPDLIMSKFN
jgi:hypothetical protein